MQEKEILFPRDAARRNHAAKTTAESEGKHVFIMYDTPNLPTNIVDFRGFDSSAILISRGGISRKI